jgi:uncharacterized membrane protein
MKLSENAIIVMKTITYRISGSALTFLVTFWVTSSVGASTMVTVARGLLGMLLYAGHDKVWEIVKRKLIS